MAASIEFKPELDSHGQAYCNSLRNIEAMGRLGRSVLESVGCEVHPVVQENFADFRTAVTENLATDEEFGEYLVVEAPTVRSIVDGKVMSLYGQTFFDIVSTGARASAEMAQKDTSYLPQSIRDEGDVLFAVEGDSLSVGEVLHTVSMDPKEHMAIDPEKWEDIGYRKGMAVQHIYYKLSEDTMLTWTNIIKHSDKSAVAQIYREDYGVDIPQDTHSDVWIRNMHRSNATLSEVQGIGRNLIDRHAELIGSPERYISVNEFVDQHMATVQQYFEYIKLDVSTALVTGENTERLQGLAMSIVQTPPDNISPDTLRGLMRIANRTDFNAEDARVMQPIVRYALLERLRKDLKKFIEQQRSAPQPTTPAAPLDDNVIMAAHVFQQQRTMYRPELVHAQQQLSAAEMNRIMARDIQAGIEAGRSAGGCTPLKFAVDRGSVTLEDAATITLKNNLFSLFDSESELDKTERDSFGSLKFECSKGHENTRGKGEIESNCETCGEYIGCGLVEDNNAVEVPPKPKKPAKKAEHISLVDRLIAA